MHHRSHALHGAGGMTLIELMIGLAIAAILMLAAAPSFTDYLANSRLREGGNLLHAQALLAQSEAIKRNTTVRLSTSGSVVQVIDRTDPGRPVVLFERRLAAGLSVDTASVDFGGEGRPIGFAASSIDVSSAAASCSSATRCPGLRIDGGGAIRLCIDHTASCS